MTTTPNPTDTSVPEGLEPCEWCKQPPETWAEPGEPHTAAIRCATSSCPVRKAGWLSPGFWNTRAAVAAPPGDGISWTALLSVLERLRSKNRNPDSEWYHGWNAAIQCLINDVNARAATSPPVAPSTTQAGEVSVAPVVEDDYVAWCRYDFTNEETTGPTISVCDSDAEGAFKVYRAAPLVAPVGDVDAEVAYPCIVDEKTLFACLQTAEQVFRKPDEPTRLERFRRTKAKLFAQAKASHVAPPASPSDAARRAAEDEGATCQWKFDPDGYWQTSCDDQFCIADGTPAENRMIYCHHCGRRIVTIDAATPAADNEGKGEQR